MKRPFIIGVGGTCSNSGKTTTAVLLLRYLAAGIGQQATESGGSGKWGGIKYTKTELYASLVDDKAVLSSKDKDTGRFIEAGAEDVIWVKSPPQDLKDLLPMAIGRLSSLDGLVVEGNSAIEFLKPDISIFIFGNDKKHWKTDFEKLAGISDIIVYDNESGLPEVAKTKRLFFGDRSGIKEHQDFLEVISDLINERKVAGRDNE